MINIVKKKTAAKSAAKKMSDKEFEKELETRIKSKIQGTFDGNKEKFSTKCHPGCGHGCSGAIYGLGFIGAAIYYISVAPTFWMGVLGFLKAMVWPVFLVYELFRFIL